MTLSRVCVDPGIQHLNSCKCKVKWKDASVEVSVLLLHSVSSHFLMRLILKGSMMSLYSGQTVKTIFFFTLIPVCSKRKWCQTCRQVQKHSYCWQSLQSARVSLNMLWSLPDVRASAFTKRCTLGISVLEFTEDDATNKRPRRQLEMWGRKHLSQWMRS